MAPGTAIDLGILRDGKPQTIHVTVGEFQNDKSQEASNAGSGEQRGKLGLAVANLSPDVRQQLNVPERVQGAAIESVRPGSPADDAGLAPGDVILEVNRHPVDGRRQFRQPDPLGACRQRRPASGLVQRRRKLSRRPSRAGIAERVVRQFEIIASGHDGGTRPVGWSRAVNT